MSKQKMIFSAALCSLVIILGSSTFDNRPKTLSETLSTLISLSGFNFEQALTQVCGNLAYQGPVSHELEAVQSAVLARILTQRLGNRANFGDDAKKKHFIDHYFTTCQSFLLPVKGLKPLNPELSVAAVIPLIDAHAKALISHALLAMNKVPNSPYYSYIHEVEWLYYNYKDDHISAEKAIRQAIAKYQAGYGNIDLAQEYGYLGTSLLQLGRFKEALYYMRQALAVEAQSMVDKHNVGGYFGIAFAYLKVGDTASARRYFEQIIMLENDYKQNAYIWDLQQCQDFKLFATKALVQLGKIDRLEGDYSAALDKHSCAVKLLTNQPDYYYHVARLEKAKDLVQLGSVKAAQKLAQSLVHNEGVFDSHKLQSLLILFALDLQRNPTQLNKKLEQQIDQLIKIQGNEINHPVEFIAFTRLKMVFAGAVGDDKAFAANATIGFKMIETYRQSMLQSDSWMSAQYAFVEDYVNARYDNQNVSDKPVFAAVIDVLDRYYALNYFDERTKYAFDVESATQPDTLAQLKLRQLSAEQALVNAPKTNKSPLQIALAEANEAVLAFQFAQPSQLDFSADEHKYNLAQVQAALQKDEVMVRYFISERRSLAFVITQGRVFIHPLPSLSDIRQTVGAIDQGLQSYELLSLMKNTHLTALLPLSFIQQNKIKKLIIIADDVLHRVPFSAIDTTAVKRPYRALGDQLEIIRTHSVYDYLFEQSQLNFPAQASNQITIFADPAFGEAKTPSTSDLLRDWSTNLQRLPATAKEAHNIEAIFGKQQVKIYEGQQMTNSRLMNETVRQSKILHIATHGYFDPSTPDVVGIATYADKTSTQDAAGFLSLSELLSKPFASDLVVISGCETMLGKYYKGSGMQSFTRGFLSQGAGSVVGTLWKIPDRSTALFMSHFYAALKHNHGDTSAALMQAKRELAKDDNFYDPFYWAGFVLTSVNRRYEQVVLD